MAERQKIVTFLWYDDKAEEAMNFYVDTFKNSRVIDVQRWPEGTPNAGQVLVCEFELDGQRFMAINGGPEFKFTEAISLYVHCDSQEEVDYYWDRLTADGGEESQCGWLKDKYGLSWQIIPDELQQHLSNPDPEKAARAMQAMLQMQKIDVAKLREAVA